MNHFAGMTGVPPFLEYVRRSPPRNPIGRHGRWVKMLKYEKSSTCHKDTSNDNVRNGTIWPPPGMANAEVDLGLIPAKSLGS